jgi:diguanylate cyclase (GGDEF)-like protein
MSLINLLIVLISALILVIVIGMVFLWRQKSFLTSLILTLESKKKHYTPLVFQAVPKPFIPLVTTLQAFEQQVPFSLTHDKLTGLANRVGFKRYLIQRLPIDQGMLVLVDIQRFRFVNNLFGFAFGDLLLNAFAERLAQLQPAAEFVSRMNGDEFILFYRQELSSDALLALKHSLQRPFIIEKTPISIKMQMGVLELKQHSADMSLMLRRLDLALKKAKQSRLGIASYKAGDDKVQYRELLIINSLPKALRDDELYLVYQPKLDLASGQCHQVEALIRWDHPSLGQLSPAEFIPLAEHTGMIDIVSFWVLDKVLAQQAAWQKEGIKVKVAVNLSTTDIDNPQLTAEIVTRLKHYKVPADSLMIEMTESILMADIERTVTSLMALRAIGVKLAIDDFGTGHSSLAYLRHLPVDEVKVDKAFLDDFETDAGSRKIVRGAIALAKHLGFEVTVEGVESKAVLDALSTYGVDTIQGDYFSKPLSSKDFKALYEKSYAVV